MSPQTALQSTNRCGQARPLPRQQALPRAQTPASTACVSRGRQPAPNGLRDEANGCKGHGEPNSRAPADRWSVSVRGEKRPFPGPPPSQPPPPRDLLLPTMTTASCSQSQAQPVLSFHQGDGRGIYFLSEPLGLQPSLLVGRAPWQGPDWGRLLRNVNRLRSSTLPVSGPFPCLRGGGACTTHLPGCAPAPAPNQLRGPVCCSESCTESQLCTGFLASLAQSSCGSGNL